MVQTPVQHLREFNYGREHCIGAMAAQPYLTLFLFRLLFRLLFLSLSRNTRGNRLCRE
ncbi:hypothetical protein ACH4UV_37415 [Streptomyces sp. NPDC020802]|uniref:hypothetical protein n=1 Tax=Streptomyces sp. NPDC020802 TaxID=3365094 RepID=UPI0037B2F944